MPYALENEMVRTNGYGIADPQEVDMQEEVIATCDFCGYEITDADTYYTDGELHICEEKVCRWDWANEMLEEVKPWSVY